MTDKQHIAILQELLRAALINDPSVNVRYKKFLTKKEKQENAKLSNNKRKKR